MNISLWKFKDFSWKHDGSVFNIKSETFFHLMHFYLDYFANQLASESGEHEERYQIDASLKIRRFL